MTCSHPPDKQYTGIFDPNGFVQRNAKTLRDYVSETMWIGCYACGEVIRPAPLAVRLDAIHEAQKRVRAAQIRSRTVFGLYLKRYAGAAL